MQNHLGYKNKSVKRTELFPNYHICAVTIYLKHPVEEENVSFIKDLSLFAFRGHSFSLDFKMG